MSIEICLRATYVHSCDRVRYLKKSKPSSRKLFEEVCICIRQSIEFILKAINLINWVLRYGQGLIYTIYKFKCGLCAKLYIMHEERNNAQNFLINYLSLTCRAEMCLIHLIHPCQTYTYIYSGMTGKHW